MKRTWGNITMPPCDVMWVTFDLRDATPPPLTSLKLIMMSCSPPLISGTALYPRNHPPLHMQAPRSSMCHLHLVPRPYCQ